MWYHFILCLALCSCIYGITEQDLKNELTKLVMQCNKNSILEVADLVMLQSFIVPTKTETKCVLACAYKAAEIMTEDGMYNLDHAYKIAELLKNGDEKRVTKAKKMADICVKVNDVKVTDGDKGCERAALIFKCTVDNAPKFGFKL